MRTVPDRLPLFHHFYAYPAKPFPSKKGSNTGNPSLSLKQQEAPRGEHIFTHRAFHARTQKAGMLEAM
ncbi:hypothetical protein PSEWESI4_00934 [Pseudomonas carbonaria]|uniref:Uncharacterized protein n=1 Tax=Zestomonas carbonaria TaxID=2762745 RepID=A0A7U7EKF8_9GAMM|nr:hypothetical protein PSEWESI4_00934 [Pseudomonas carbonaria]